MLYLIKNFSLRRNICEKLCILFSYPWMCFLGNSFQRRCRYKSCGYRYRRNSHQIPSRSWLAHIYLKNFFWRKSLFSRMWFSKRASTTGKVTVSDALKKEIALTSHYDTALVKTFKIPPSVSDTFEVCARK